MPTSPEDLERIVLHLRGILHRGWQDPDTCKRWLDAFGSPRERRSWLLHCFDEWVFHTWGRDTDK